MATGWSSLSNLGKFGEDGPWTNVFRLTKANSKTARTMIADILDTPLLKLKLIHINFAG